MNGMRTASAIAVALLVIAVSATSTFAATLWRGVLVVTARTATAACIAEYDVGESFVIDYRPNLGTTASETVMVFGPFGAYLLTSLSTDVDKTLRTGGVSITGAAYATGYSRTNASQPIAISPATITSATLGISMSGTIANLGVVGCNVSFRAAMLPVYSPF